MSRIINKLSQFFPITVQILAFASFGLAAYLTTTLQGPIINYQKVLVLQDKFSACQARLLKSGKSFINNHYETTYLSNKYMDKTEQCFHESIKSIEMVKQLPTTMLKAVKEYYSEVEAFHNKMLRLIILAHDRDINPLSLKRTYAQLQVQHQMIVREMKASIKSFELAGLPTQNNYFMLAVLCFLTFFLMDIIIRTKKSFENKHFDLKARKYINLKEVVNSKKMDKLFSTFFAKNRLIYMYKLFDTYINHIIKNELTMMKFDKLSERDPQMAETYGQTEESKEITKLKTEIELLKANQRKQEEDKKKKEKESKYADTPHYQQLSNYYENYDVMDNAGPYAKPSARAERDDRAYSQQNTRRDYGPQYQREDDSLVIMNTRDQMEEMSIDNQRNQITHELQHKLNNLEKELLMQSRSIQNNGMDSVDMLESNLSGRSIPDIPAPRRREYHEDRGNAANYRPAYHETLPPSENEYGGPSIEPQTNLLQSITKVVSGLSNKLFSHSMLMDINIKNDITINLSPVKLEKMYQYLLGQAIQKGMKINGRKRISLQAEVIGISVVVKLTTLPSGLSQSMIEHGGGRHFKYPVDRKFVSLKEYDEFIKTNVYLQPIRDRLGNIVGNSCTLIFKKNGKLQRPDPYVERRMNSQQFSN
jgi:hypothetical protein